MSGLLECARCHVKQKTHRFTSAQLCLFPWSICTGCLDADAARGLVQWEVVPPPSLPTTSPSAAAPPGFAISGYASGEAVFAPVGRDLGRVLWDQLAALYRQEKTMHVDEPAHDPNVCRCPLCCLAVPKALEFVINPGQDSVEIEGVKYSGEVLRALATARPGDTFMFRRRVDGLEVTRSPFEKADPFAAVAGAVPSNAQSAVLREALDKYVPKLLKDQLLSVTVERELVREPQQPGETYVRRTQGKKWLLTVIAQEN